MASIDVVELVNATNFIHQKLNEVVAAQATGKTKEAVAHCREAVAVACRAMQELFNPHRDELSLAIGQTRDIAALSSFLQNRESVIQFLNAEERLLKEAGLEPGLVDAVMNRCIDFLEREPEKISSDDLRRAFSAVEFRVCQDAADKLSKVSEKSDKYSWIVIGRTALTTAIGITIIAVNYKFLGPLEFSGQISTGYGLSWLPIWPLKG